MQYLSINYGKCYSIREAFQKKLCGNFPQGGGGVGLIQTFLNKTKLVLQCVLSKASKSFFQLKEFGELVPRFAIYFISTNIDFIDSCRRHNESKLWDIFVSFCFVSVCILLQCIREAFKNKNDETYGIFHMWADPPPPQHITF